MQQTAVANSYWQAQIIALGIFERCEALCANEIENGETEAENSHTIARHSKIVVEVHK